VYLTLVLRGNKYVTTDRRKILFAWVVGNKYINTEFYRRVERSWK
jgi:hypothetical protein